MKKNSKIIVGLVVVLLIALFGCILNQPTFEEKLEDATGLKWETIEIEDGIVYHCPSMQASVTIVDDEIYFDGGMLITDIGMTCDILGLIEEEFETTMELGGMDSL